MKLKRAPFQVWIFQANSWESHHWWTSQQPRRGFICLFIDVTLLSTHPTLMKQVVRHDLLTSHPLVGPFQRWRAQQRLEGDSCLLQTNPLIFLVVTISNHGHPPGQGDSAGYELCHSLRSRYHSFIRHPSVGTTPPECTQEQ